MYMDNRDFLENFRDRMDNQGNFKSFMDQDIGIESQIMFWVSQPTSFKAGTGIFIPDIGPGLLDFIMLSYMPDLTQRHLTLNTSPWSSKKFRPVPNWALAFSSDFNHPTKKGKALK